MQKGGSPAIADLPFVDLYLVCARRITSTRVASAVGGIAALLGGRHSSLLANMNEEPMPKSLSPPSSAAVGDAQSSQQDSANDNKTSTSNATFPKQNAWGNATGSNNAKKRSNVESIDTLNSGIINNESSKPKTFADIMAEQQLEKNLTKPTTKVKFCHEVESEEERMMRLAIEASLQDHHQQQGVSSGGFISHATKLPPSVLKNNDGTQNSNNISFSNTNNIITYDENDDMDMDDDMKMAIALSLQEGEGSSAVILDDGFGNVKEGKAEEEEDEASSIFTPFLWLFRGRHFCWLFLLKC